MTLRRTLTAECDHRTSHLGHEVRSCTVVLDMNPDTTQPWRDMRDQGWEIDHASGDDTIPTYCPDHKDDAKH